MTGCERILARLQQGPATAAELYALGVMVHSRVADLRKRGHAITCEHVPGKTGTARFEYRLLSDGGTMGTAGTGDAPAVAEQPDMPPPGFGCSPGLGAGNTRDAGPTQSSERPAPGQLSIEDVLAAA